MCHFNIWFPARGPNRADFPTIFHSTVRNFTLTVSRNAPAGAKGQKCHLKRNELLLVSGDAESRLLFYWNFNDWLCAQRGWRLQMTMAIKQVITRPTNRYDVRFLSLYVKTKRHFSGFWLNVRLCCSTGDRYCGGRLDKPSGTFKTPNWPEKDYPAGVTCSWHIVAPKNQVCLFKTESSFCRREGKTWKITRINMPAKRWFGICGLQGWTWLEAGVG